MQLTPQQQLAEANSSLARMESSRANVRRMLANARAQRDVVKTLCLDDKLSQLDVAIRSARERKDSLEIAVNRSDTDLANHEFTILSVLRQRADTIAQEANQCIGKEAGFISDDGTKVSSDIDPNIPSDDETTNIDPIIDVVVDPPACSSCFR